MRPVPGQRHSGARWPGSRGDGRQHRLRGLSAVLTSGRRRVSVGHSHALDKRALSLAVGRDAGIRVAALGGRSALRSHIHRELDFRAVGDGGAPSGRLEGHRSGRERVDSDGVDDGIEIDTSVVPMTVVKSKASTSVQNR